MDFLRDLIKWMVWHPTTTIVCIILGGVLAEVVIHLLKTQ